MREAEKKIRIGRNYIGSRSSSTVFYLKNADYGSGPDYLKFIESFSFPLVIKLKYSPLPKERASRTLARKLADRRSEIRYNRTMGDSERARLKRQIHDMEAMAMRIASRGASLARLKMMFRVKSSHPVKLRESSRIFSHLMKLIGFKTEQLSLPTRSMLRDVFSPFSGVGSSYLMDSESVSTILPVFFSSSPERSGVAIGVDDLTEKPVFADPFGKSSHNILVFGETGSGKSFFSKLLLMRMEVTSSTCGIIVLDPLNEYSCRMFGEDCFEVKTHEFPHDLMDSARTIIFKVSSLVDNGRDDLLADLLSEVYASIRKQSDTRKTVLIDEAHLLLGNRKSLEVLSRLVRHSRHFSTSVICVTQNMDDLSKNQLSSVIAENSTSVYLFRMKGFRAADKTRFGIDRFEDTETEYLMGGKNSPYSECYALEDNRMRKVRVLSTQLENEIIAGRGESNSVAEDPSLHRQA